MLASQTAWLFYGIQDTQRATLASTWRQALRFNLNPYRSSIALRCLQLPARQRQNHLKRIQEANLSHFQVRVLPITLKELRYKVIEGGKKDRVPPRHFKSKLYNSCVDAQKKDLHHCKPLI